MQNVASLRVLLTRAFPLNIALEASHLLSLDTWRALHHTAFSEHHRLSSESQTKGLQQILVCFRKPLQSAGSTPLRSLK